MSTHTTKIQNRKHIIRNENNRVYGKNQGAGRGLKFEGIYGKNLRGLKFEKTGVFNSVKR